MKIVIFGANGKVGQLLTTHALRNGNQVTAAVHNTNPFTEQNSRLTVTKVDVFDAESINQAVSDNDAVISCLGSWGTKSKNILATGMDAILPAMKKHKINRIVSLTGAAALLPDENTNVVDKLNRQLLVLVANKVVADSESHLALLANTNLDWTVVRSPVMTNWGNSDYQLTNSSPMPWQTISRHAVAKSLLDLATSNQHSQQAPFITRN